MADQQHTGFVLQRPDDDGEIDEMFVDLMRRRGWHNLPDQATGVMRSYPPDKKWSLIYQDRLVEWESLLRRQTELVE
jgi:cytokinesis protein